MQWPRTLSSIHVSGNGHSCLDKAGIAEAVGINSCLRGLRSCNTEHNIKRASPEEAGATIASATGPEPYLTLQILEPVILKRRS